MPHFGNIATIATTHPDYCCINEKAVLSADVNSAIEILDSSRVNESDSLDSTGLQQDVGSRSGLVENTSCDTVLKQGSCTNNQHLDGIILSSQDLAQPSIAPTWFYQHDLQ